MNTAVGAAIHDFGLGHTVNMRNPKEDEAADLVRKSSQLTDGLKSTGDEHTVPSCLHATITVYSKT